jgi:hypothetical protein
MQMKKVFGISLFVQIVLVAFSLMDAQSQNSGQKKDKKHELSGIEIIKTNPDGLGTEIIINFLKGEMHNHPTLAIWVEDSSGNFIQTLYVSKSIGTSVFQHGTNYTGQWTQGMVRRPAALPYWSHKRGIMADDGLYLPTPDNPVPDAYTGATPLGSFELNTRLDKPGQDIINILLEINQPWDWNEYWTNDKYPEDYEYNTSSQPAVVYQATIDLTDNPGTVPMKVIGHSHYSGMNGELFEDISTISSALEIAESITVTIK